MYRCAGLSLENLTERMLGRAMADIGEATSCKTGAKAAESLQSAANDFPRV